MAPMNRLAQRAILMTFLLIHLVFITTFCVETLDTNNLEDQKTSLATTDRSSILEDTTAPAACTDFSIQSSGETVYLAWVNPMDEDLAGVIVVQSLSNSTISAPERGEAAYVHMTLGTGEVIQTSKHPFAEVVMSCSQEYYFTLFAYDAQYNYSPGILLSYTQYQNKLGAITIDDEYAQSNPSAIIGDNGSQDGLGNKEYAIAYQSKELGDWDIYFASTNTSGVLQSKFLMYRGEGDQTQPKIVWLGNEYGVFWMDNERGENNSDIHFMRVREQLDGSFIKFTYKPDGTQSENSKFIISDAYSLQTNPIIEVNDMNYAVVWTDTRNNDQNIYYSLYNKTNDSMIQSNVKILNIADKHQSVKGIHWINAQSKYLVLWIEGDTSAESITHTEMFAELINENGSVDVNLGEPNLLATSDTHFNQMITAYNGTRGMVAYSQSIINSKFAGKPSFEAISTCLIDSSGTIVPSSCKSLSSESMPANGSYYSKFWERGTVLSFSTDQIPQSIVVVDSSTFALAYEDYSRGYADILIVLIDANTGALKDLFPMEEYSLNDQSPNLFYINNQFSCIWNRFHSTNLNNPTSLFFGKICELS